MSDKPGRPGLVGALAAGAHHTGALTFQGRVRIDGTHTGSLKTDDLLEVGPEGRIDGEVEAVQALIAGTVDGILRVKERVTLTETAVVRGKVVTPWLDVHLGARLLAEVVVDRGR